MKRVLFGVLAAGAILTCLVGVLLAQAPAKPDWREGFRTHDINHDGKIDRAEFQDWMVDVFFNRDTNHKGYLVFTDVQDVITIEKFKLGDRNGDGRMTLEEFLNALFQDFEAADLNNSGTLTMEEIDVYITQARK
jgi:Ca2+-binding EF-hand superfamily protein